MSRPKKPVRKPKDNQDEYSGPGDNKDNPVRNENVETPRSPIRREPAYEERYVIIGILYNFIFYGCAEIH